MRSFGRFTLFLSSMFVRRESFMTYVRLVIEESIKIGFNSILLVGIVSTFIGAVTTLQTAYNLVSPFIPSYVISLVVRDMTLLELAPTVMAIVYAGKVGSNIAGELGTMRITEQIDALEVMGINAASYLVLPKIIASLITYPMLVVVSAFLSLVGGYLAGSLAGVITPTEFVYGIRYEFIPFNITFALTKAYVFAFLVAAISAYKGFYTKGGALEVGVASTSAVTNSCIAILCADFLLTKLML
ncbi:MULTISPECIES: MlaE family ABC transporter permease [Reichenbachiella]|uniref:Phospholipid/cholesterol/gamma-HCH transport system permease protein n=1 Tax=Reichenbachiella agariperforans TaxID=156994 RepID=A0A1M6RF40_REIAG|nr:MULTISPECIES: ABC transporter permease [Reichenbachiella]MBU2915351.1 ABC transporter permease [Reichenbachiella agariperforans]RJE70573.1 ABC transporter permease [Reichenbachiella sp. MSK19-1]SHK30977.1 phospholipid/cholesterol/gamma-HCH transport system permease protein [Reichenbachiella agariperforans]